MAQTKKGEEKDPDDVTVAIAKPKGKAKGKAKAKAKGKAKGKATHAAGKHDDAKKDDAQRNEFISQGWLDDTGISKLPLNLPADVMKKKKNCYTHFHQYVHIVSSCCHVFAWLALVLFVLVGVGGVVVLVVANAGS